jgi:dynein heavy chain
MIFQVLLIANDINPIELDFLLRFPFVPNLTTPVDFMNNNSWGGIKVCISNNFSFY